MSPARVAVIGAGIAGLSAAYELTHHRRRVEVVVFEGADEVGGRLVPCQLGSSVVDAGADGFLSRRPEALELCTALGITDQIVPLSASGASLWTGQRTRKLPEGLAIGVPTRFWPVARSRVLGPAALARLALDVVAPRPDIRQPLGDRAVGPLVSRKLGRGATARLIDPLVGGIHAASVADMSAAAVFPDLLTAAQRRGSFMRAMRAVSPPPAPMGAPSALVTVAGGVHTMALTLRKALEARDVDIETGHQIESIELVDGTWRIAGEHFDAVVLAVPATTVAELIDPIDPEAAALAAGIPYASVATVHLALESGRLPAEGLGTGVLVPRGSRFEDDTFMTTAVSLLTRKWPGVATPETEVVRASVGRSDDLRFGDVDDDALIARVCAELSVILATELVPSATAVTRFDGAFPQYKVHHLLRVAGLESALARIGAVRVCGSAYRGVGIPACIGSGRSAARSILEVLAAT